MALGTLERDRLELTAEAREPIIEIAVRARLEGADSQLRTEQQELDRVRKLVAQKLLSASNLDRQKASRDGA